MHHSMHEVDVNAGSYHAPNVRRRSTQAYREHSKYDLPRPSVLAGLGGIGRGMHRVSDWVGYVEPGPPDVDQGATAVQ